MVGLGPQPSREGSRKVSSRAAQGKRHVRERVAGVAGSMALLSLMWLLPYMGMSGCFGLGRKEPDRR